MGSEMCIRDRNRCCKVPLGRAGALVPVAVPAALVSELLPGKAVTHAFVPRIKFLAALVKNATLVGARARYTAASLGAQCTSTSITMAQPLRLNPRAFAACASWLDAAEDDDEAATAPEAPRPTGPRAGLGAAPRARKTQQDASLAARIARDDRKRGGGRGGGRGRRRGDDSDDLSLKHI